MDQCTDVMEDPQFWLRLRMLIADDDRAEAKLLLIKQLKLWTAQLEAEDLRMN